MGLAETQVYARGLEDEFSSLGRCLLDGNVEWARPMFVFVPLTLKSKFCEISPTYLPTLFDDQEKNASFNGVYNI